MQSSRDPAVKEVLGLQQRLRKIIKNRRKIIKMQNQFCWVRVEETYLFLKACIGFFFSVFELKIQTQFGVFLVLFKICTCYELEFWICCSLYHV
jgi:hypothetical protein